MLRQLARLTRPVPAAGPRAIALAVYADERDEPVAAADDGVEGIACVDDAARALVLYSHLASRGGSDDARARVDGLLDILLYMEVAPGRYVNFLLDWTGARNVDGPTSRSDGGFWNARALLGLAAASVACRRRDADAALARRLASARGALCAGDLRAIEAAALLEIVERGDDAGALADLERWCDEIAEQRRGDVLLDHPGQTTPHLWAHAQEAVLARAGPRLGRDDLVRAGQRSAEIVFVPQIVAGFPAASVPPDAVASAVAAMDALAAATRDPRYPRLSMLARAWFDGRNPAGARVYDRDAGRVADGIDDGRVSLRSGAEANIAAAAALIDRVTAHIPRGGLAEQLAS